MRFEGFKERHTARGLMRNSNDVVILNHREIRLANGLIQVLDEIARIFEA